MGTPLIEIRQLRREFQSGEQSVAVLKDVDLSIEAGEMVAIVGASGSGKSTLMNIIGCLDQATSGSYLLDGKEMKKLSADELAALRRERFGFIFQRYHLLSDLTAQGNVEVPSIYAGQSASQRHARSLELLERLGLADRVDHKPCQLSGGQQQRVSIARALMNGGSIILADEPTGALDGHSGKEVMKILTELHEAGHTIIIVTHDMHNAEYADRIIEISDGQIIADRKKTSGAEILAESNSSHVLKENKRPLLAMWDRLSEAFRMTALSMRAHKLRTFLTMLGIIIGIAAVVSVVALGAGLSEGVRKNISAMGTNTIEIYPGMGYGDARSGKIRTLVPADASTLATQSYVDSVTPNVTTSVTLRYRNVEASASVQGVSSQYFRVKDQAIAEGMAFDQMAEQQFAQVAVIDQNTRDKLFVAGEDPLGEVILLGTTPVRIIGVAEKKDSAFGNSDALNIFVPYTTVMKRMLGQSFLRNITVRVTDDVSMAAAEQGINHLLTLRHGRQDFFIINTDSVRQTVESTTGMVTLVISSIAIISLVVGGIGVMNIMLVSVTERTREIGVRMAVGARQSDIQQQFLIESVQVCVLGGALGISLALLFGWLFSYAGTEIALVFSTTSMVVAFACSTMIGIVFGYLPASRAARLNPVDALASD